MASHELIDAQFDRAVQMVQSLPKTGPIQTDYEEKLTMYSLFKQATVGNVKGPRPGIWDMIGRAKWDAWAKHKDLDTHEAKQLYVEALLKILRKYSDKTIARNLVEELISLGGTAAQSSVLRITSPSSESSGSTTSDRGEESAMLLPSQISPNRDDELTTEDEFEDEPRELPPMNLTRTPLENRPPSSLSSQRYRTPLAGSLAMSPPLRDHVPTQQPRPIFETPSAFANTQVINAPMGSITRNLPYDSNDSGQPLERSVERLQIQLAAVTERLGTLESRALLLFKSNLGPPVPPGIGTSSWLSGQGSGQPATFEPPQWDIDDLGMWSLVLNPLSRGITRLRELAIFFARNDHRSPSMTIVRRLCLDVSFLLSVIVILRGLWIRSGARRREVKVALIILWRAIVGSNTPGSHDYL